MLSTGLIKGLKRIDNERKIIVLTLYPELFKNNPDVSFILSEKKYNNLINHLDKKLLWRIAKYLGEYRLKKVHHPGYKFPCKDKHLIDDMAESVNVQLLSSERRPFIYLTKNEIKNQLWAKNTIVIQSSSTNYWTVNKHWIPGRMQKVVNELNKYYKIVHVGSKNDERLENVIDLRGKTTIRESASILKNARLFVGLEGGIVHLARAVEKKSVVIYTGYTKPEETGYTENRNLRSSIARSSCWKRSKCQHCHRSSLAIQSEDVIKEIKSICSIT